MPYPKGKSPIALMAISSDGVPDPIIDVGLQMASKAGVPDPIIDAGSQIASKAMELVRGGMSSREAFTKIAGEHDEPYRTYALDWVREHFG